MNNRYNQVISEFVKQTSLKRIRVKIDPRITSDFDQASEYEGFVLEEDNLGNVVVFIPELGDEFEVPYADYDVCGSDEPKDNPHFEHLKNHIILELIESDQVSSDDPELDNILSFNNIHQLHTYLGEKNISDDIFLDILKSYFNNE